MDLVQRRKQLRQRQVDKVKKFRQSNMSASAAVQKQKEREEMKKEVRKEIEKETQKESMNIEHSNGTTFARVMDIIGPSHMRPLVSNGVWKGTEQISEKKSDCECDDCGQDPCIECGESHHSVKEAKVEVNRSDYGKASVRNKRKFGKEGEPAVFDASGERGKMIDQRRAEHKAKRSVKTKGVSEAVGAVAGGAAKVALGGAAVAGKVAVKGAKFAGKTAAYLGKKAGNRIGKELVKATSDVDNNADKEFDKVKVKRYKETPVKEQMEKDNGVDDQQQKQIDSKQKKADQIKKQVLLKKLQAVRQGGGSEIMASYSWREDKTMRINKILNS